MCSINCLPLMAILLFNKQQYLLNYLIVFKMIKMTYLLCSAPYEKVNSSFVLSDSV